MMSNHFHMLISTPNANLSEAMNFFMRETSKEMNRISGSVNQVYGGRYSRTLIDSQLYFSSAYKYVYRNPVKAGLSETCEEYPYSTLNGVIGLGLVRVPTTEDTFLFGTGVENTLKWLNTAPSDIDYEIFKIGLKRKILKFPRNKWAPVRHALDKRPL
ncbi:MAG: hypothetical protein H7326_01965 [Bdellovibrionaceae bacterium]|nr:hypothetical protein [Pseudobdellovibrionaceae bacterium]